MTTKFNDAWKDNVEVLKGGWKNQLSTARNKFQRHTKYGTQKYIGIASNAKKGCIERWNNTHKKGGLNRMMALYETTSDDFRRNMEINLIDLLFDDLENERRGGGGNVGNPPYIVYCVWKE
jgi:hypothetical protein